MGRAETSPGETARAVGRSTARSSPTRTSSCTTTARAGSPWPTPATTSPRRRSRSSAAALRAAPRDNSPPFPPPRLTPPNLNFIAQEGLLYQTKPKLKEHTTVIVFFADFDVAFLFGLDEIFCCALLMIFCYNHNSSINSHCLVNLVVHSSVGLLAMPMTISW